MQRILLVIVVLLVVWRLLAAIGRRLSTKAPGADSFSRFSPEARRRRKQWTGSGQPSVEELVEADILDEEAVTAAEAEMEEVASELEELEELEEEVERLRNSYPEDSDASA